MGCRWRRSVAGAGVIAGAIACSTYGERDDANPTDGGADAASPSDAGKAAETSLVDGPTVATGPYGVRPACPPPKGAACEPGACTQIPLFTPPSPEEPFGIATDIGHLYVASQRVVAGGPDAYDGKAPGTIRRIDKTGGGATILANGELAATRVVVEGDYVDWATRSANASFIRGVRRDCMAPKCEPIVRATSLNEIIDLVPVSEGVLVGLDISGQVVRIDLVAGTVTTIGATSAFAELGRTNDATFITGQTQTAILRSLDAGATTTFANIAPSDGGAAGFFHVATDCSSLWLSRLFTPTVQLWTRAIAVPGPFAPVVSLPADTYALAVDATHVWAGSANTGGIWAFPKTAPASGGFAPVATGNVFAIAVDDEGVYWGEHGAGATGTITMLVK